MVKQFTSVLNDTHASPIHVYRTIIQPCYIIYHFHKIEDIFLKDYEEKI